MHLADELSCWYDLRDVLRGEQGRCKAMGRSFPAHRQRLMEHAEATIARLERLKRSAPRSSDPQPTLPNPAVTPREDHR